MSLGDFKVIYWWEWSHRQLARTTGAVYLLPFLFFLARGWIPKSIRPRLWGVLALFGLLATVGWWMVASGLTGTRVAVSPYWLAFHLTLASTLYLAVVWTAQQLKSRAPGEAPRRARNVAVTIVGLLLLQIYLGALVAGNNAGLVYNTWPLIDGAFIPSAERLWFIAPFWRNIFENTLTVQFDHRMLAYAIWLLALYQAWAMRRDTGAVVLAIAVTLQAALGIFTLLYHVPLHLALSHQLLAIVVFTIAIGHAEKLTHRPPV
jgi:cytochrome c oxidase assembly protein subunit 15